MARGRGWRSVRGLIGGYLFNWTLAICRDPAKMRPLGRSSNGSMAMHSPSEARALLAKLGAPPRLVRHVELVSEAAESLLVALRGQAIPFDERLVLAGVLLHDVGKILHPRELDHPGAEHESAGERLLLEHGVEPRLAKICVTHARWSNPGTTFDELIVALADKLWKGVRRPDLEQLVIDTAAQLAQKTRWDLFVALDSVFEEIAARGEERLERSRSDLGEDLLGP